jgi:tetratricopeptide (TPR) repeat protein
VSTLLWSTAYAGDKPNIGPPPAWVKPVSLPSAPPASDGAPIRILLSDQQIEFQPGRQTVYTDSAVRIQTPQGLAVGNLSFPWRPDTDDITVHKLVIRRGDKVIDVLASGQTFTVIRREQNLESATLDGMLTANIQPEGLEVGDVLEFAASITSSDPTLKSHVEQVAGAWNGAPVDHAHIRVKWPSTLPVRLRENGTLPPLKPVTENGVTAIDLSIDDLKPVIPPKGAPPRYGIGRALEFTDFKSWADLGALLAPLYQKAAIVGAQGPLRTELERIRQLSPDPKLRAQAALALVQDRIRYVALAMGAGGLVPADAETTWARRYGDCKAKTALLLALLHELGMEAEPVAVNASGGDGIDRRLPMIGLFDHVLVRATIDGKAYWLDGTRLGDASLDRVAVPDFGWGLPLVPAGAALVRILPPPLEVPAVSTSIHMDASGGLMTPAPTQIETVMRGDAAIALNLTLSGLTGETRDTALRQYWRGEYDFIDVKKADATFDPKTGEERLSMEGAARMDWSSGLYETDGTGLGYKADFSRDPGPDQDAPFATPYPFFTRTVETIVMPPNTAIPAGDFKGDVDETVAGVQYHRHATVSGPTITVDASQRSIAPEFPAKDAPAAQQKLRELANQAVAITKPRDYQATAADIKALVTSNPTTASEFESRGSAFLDQSKFDEALADFEHAVSLDPRSASALADRGLAHVWKSQFEPAAKDLDAANAIDPKNAVVFRARGLMAQKKGDNREAIAAFTKALDIEPGNTFALAHRAEVDYAAGELEAALSDAAEVLKRSPKLVASYLLRSTILIRQGKPDAAATEADALVAAMPDNSYAQVAAGNIYATVHKEAQAMRAFDRAIAIKPEGYIYLNRALHRPKSDLTGRRTDVDTAMAMDPKLTQAVSAKADLQVEQGDFAGAAATYSKRLEGTPEDLGLLTGRGIVYARAGDGVRADKDFAAVRAKAAQPGVLNNLCWAKATAGVALDSALDDCNAALAKAPDNPSFLDSRGLVFLRLGRFDDAIADYDRALKTRPTQPTSLFGRAVAWARKGDTAKSDADVVAAQKADSAVRATFERYGVKLR